MFVQYHPARIVVLLAIFGVAAAAVLVFRQRVSNAPPASAPEERAHVLQSSRAAPGRALARPQRADQARNRGLHALSRRDPEHEAASVDERVDALARAETLSKADVRALLEEALEGRLSDRELSDQDYDALANAVLRIRASHRVLGGIEPTTASAETLATYRTDLADALTQLETITGIPPSDLGRLVDLEEGLSTDDGVPAQDRAPTDDTVREEIPETLEEFARERAP